MIGIEQLVGRIQLHAQFFHRHVDGCGLWVGFENKPAVRMAQFLLHFPDVRLYICHHARFIRSCAMLWGGRITSRPLSATVTGSWPTVNSDPGTTSSEAYSSADTKAPQASR